MMNGNLSEFFGVNANDYLTSIDSIEEQNAWVGERWPGTQIETKILERGKESLLYEWMAKENGTEQTYGWGRVFATNQGTVVLEYRAKGAIDFAKNRSIWLPLLKQARIISGSSIKK